MRPVSGSFQLLLVEGSKVGDRGVDRPIDLGADRRRFPFGVGDQQAAGTDLNAVEAGERLAHREIAPIAHIVDQAANIGAKRWVENVSKTAVEDSDVWRSTSR